MVAVRQAWGPGNGIALGGGTSISTLALNDADNSASTNFHLPEDGPINKLCFNVSAVTGTPELNVALVTVDSSGNPTTTPYGGSAVKAVSAWSVGWNEITLDTPATAVAGDRVAVRIWPSGAGNVPDATNHNLTIRSRLSLLAQDVSAWYNEFLTAWTKTTGGYPIATARYSSGLYCTPTIANTGSTIASASLNTGTTPDEIGNLLQVPAEKECYGARVCIKLNAATANITVNLYNSAGTLQRSCDIDGDEVPGVGTYNWFRVFWDPITLAADTNYRLTVLPTTATSIQVPEILTPNNTDGRASIPEGSRWQKTSRVDAGAFTDDDVSVIVMALIISDITVDEGGGSTTNIFMVQD